VACAGLVFVGVPFSAGAPFSDGVPSFPRSVWESVAVTDVVLAWEPPVELEPLTPGEPLVVSDPPSEVTEPRRPDGLFCSPRR
jgi:hypothetical protein